MANRRFFEDDDGVSMSFRVHGNRVECNINEYSGMPKTVALDKLDVWDVIMELKVLYEILN